MGALPGQLVIDGEMSTNDCVFVLANGSAGNAKLANGTPQFRRFVAALADLCDELARDIAADGEGATKLLDQWKVTLNEPKQKRIATQLQKIFLSQMPIVPLFIGPRWSTYSTKYFHGFSSPKNFYGDPIFTTFPDNILSFTRICPGGKSGA